MKVLLALTIILSGVLITKSSYADAPLPSTVYSNNQVVVSGIDYKKHLENADGKYHCPLDAHNGNKGGIQSQDSIASGSHKTAP